MLKKEIMDKIVISYTKKLSVNDPNEIDQVILANCQEPFALAK